MRPYCFVITSFGQKPDIKDLQTKFAAKKVDESILRIDFDRVYEQLVKPAIIDAGLEPLIEREEENLGVIHKTMYEKIILCEFCVADITNANPNAYYELGMRYAVRPYSTIPIIASTHFPLPFDIGFDRTLTYEVDDDFQFVDLERDKKQLTAALQRAINNRATDSPLYDLVNGISFQNSVAHEKTDVFREKVVYDEGIKTALAYARATASDDPQNRKTLQIAAINQVIAEHQPLAELETAVLIDMMISFRNIEAFPEMRQFIELLPRYVRETVMVQEQYAFVLNRLANKSKPVDEVMIGRAESVLQKLEEAGKASSETYGIWGRIHKDKFDRAYRLQNEEEAEVHLENALSFYEKGFLFDIRDAYPAVNYVTCLELTGQREKALRLVPVVEQAVITKMSKRAPDYWDYATLLELCVIENRYSDAKKYFYKAKPLMVETWMPDTTAGNLEKIMHYRQKRGEEVGSLSEVLALFSKK